MDRKDAIKELEDIRLIMERSSRFQSVSGWGVTIAGVLALLASFVADRLFNHGTYGWFTNIFGDTDMLWSHKTQIAVFGSLALLIICAGTIFLSSMWMARRKKIPFAFDATMRRTILNFSVPLLAGGILCLALVLQGHYGLTSSIMLIFYGLALINCHHFSIQLLGYLGYAELLLGLADCFVSTHALLFWAIGFGVLHILFGLYLATKGRSK